MEAHSHCNSPDDNTGLPVSTGLLRGAWGLEQPTDNLSTPRWVVCAVGEMHPITFMFPCLEVN